MSYLERKKEPSQRQLRVGEEIRHVISSILQRNETHDPRLDGLSITVSEVRISPDLKNASVFVTPLAGGVDISNLVELLNGAAPAIRKLISKRIVLKYSPKLQFKPDRSFEEAGKIHQLLRSPDVVKDLHLDDDETE